MKYSENKFRKDEIRDFELFDLFQQRLESKDIYFPTVYGTPYDLQVVKNRTNKIEIVEVKCRNNESTKYEDCFIELTKWNNLMKQWRENYYLPLYINFFGNCSETGSCADDVWVWVLPEVKNPNLYLNVKIYGEEQDRLGLRFDNGYHYKWNGSSYDVTPPKIKNKYDNRKMAIFDGDLDLLIETKELNIKKLYNVG